MNIAFQAVVLVILALPGIIFNRLRCRSQPLSEKRAFTDEVVGSLMAATLLHAACVTIFDFCGSLFGLRVDLNSALMISMGQFGKDNVNLLPAVESITKHTWSVLSYFLVIYVAAAVCGQRFSKWSKEPVESRRQPGRLVRWLVSWLSADANLRRWNEWEAHIRYSGDKAVIPILTTVIPIGNAAYLYAGQLVEMVPDDDGHPHRFILRDVCRRRMEETDDKFVQVDGDLFIIRSSEAMTLNIMWVGLGAESLVPEPAE